MARRTTPSPGSNAGRVALYVRVSALMGRSGDDFHSPAVQIDGMRGLVSREGLREVAVIDDDIDASGQTFKRAGIDRIRAMVEAGQVDVVAVYALSRVGRNLADALAFIRWLRDRGVAIISANEKIDETPEGQFLLGMWLNMAELQGNQIASSWSRVIARRATQLGRTHGPTNQGYLRDEHGDYIIDPHLGPAVQELFAGYANGGIIGELLSAYSAARGKPIRRHDLKGMLRNPVYIGHVVVDSKAGGHIDVAGAHPALVDDVTWRRVQKRLEGDRHVPARHLAPAYSLTGLGLCAHCDHNVQVTYSRERPEEPTRRLLCAHKKLAKGCEGIGAPRYEPIEEAVLDQVRHHVAKLRGDPAARVAQEAKVEKAATDVPSLKSQVVKTRAAMGRLTEAWARGNIRDDAYEEGMSRLTITEEAQSAALSVAREVRDAPAPTEIIALAEELLELWPDLSGSHRNRGLKTVLQSFTVRKAKYWGEPEEVRLADFKFRWTT